MAHTMRHTFLLIRKGANQRSKMVDYDGKEQPQEKMSMLFNQLKEAPHAPFLQYFQHQPHHSVCYSGP